MKTNNEISKLFSIAAKESFGSYLNYAFITGSANYIDLQNLQRNSDIDILLVLDNSILKSKEELIKRRTKFNSFYFGIHENYLLVPDSTFPGEIISKCMIEDIIHGRGFSEDDGKLHYEDISGNDSEWIDNPTLEYRCWRSMFLFSKNNSHISGNKEAFLEDKKLITLPLIFYLLDLSENQINNSIITIDDVWNYITLKMKNSNKNDFGYSRSYENELFLGNIIKDLPINELFSKYSIINDDGETINHNMLNDCYSTFLHSLRKRKFILNKNPFLI